jgi:CRISPR/Cas system-associated exonuclease Cas4 (RecB family)
MSRFGNVEATVDDANVLSGNQFGHDGELDLEVDFYGEAPVSDHLEHISKSRVKTFLKCQRKFADKYLAEERADENFYMERGSAVHDAFEKFHQTLKAFVAANNELPNSLTELLPHASEWFQFVEYVGPFFEWELDRLKTARQNTESEAEALEAWTPHSVEVSLTIDDPPVGELPWLGPYDALVDARSVSAIENNDGYVVIDYKTGSLPKEQWRDEGIHIDLEFYAWMLEEAGYEVAGGIGMYPSEDGNVIREMPNPETRADIADVVTYLHESSVTRIDYPTDPQPLCEYCHFYDQCPTSWSS